MVLKGENLLRAAERLEALVKVSQAKARIDGALFAQTQFDAWLVQRKGDIASAAGLADVELPELEILLDGSPLLSGVLNDADDDEVIQRARRRVLEGAMSCLEWSESVIVEQLRVLGVDVRGGGPKA